jgi:hypothetical protein
MRERSEPQRPSSSKARPTRGTAGRLAWLFPALVTVVLCAPRLGLGYFWDDYIFLTAGQADPKAFLLPNSARTIFYRPISMGLYFLILNGLGPWGSVAGHVFNLALLVAAVLLVAALTAKIAGSRAGLLAGYSFAALTSVPSLVAWTTGSQDLLAILFILVALYLRHLGRVVPAFIAAACAVFSKETALALVPALVLWPWPLRRPERFGTATILGAAVIALWGAVHPGVHAFLAHGFRSEATGYVRVQDSTLWLPHMGTYLLTLAHAPWTGYSMDWPRELTWSAAAAVALLGAGLWLGSQVKTRGSARGESVPWPRIIILASLLILPPLLLDVVLVGHWAPYYASLPGIGSALLLGVLLAKIPIRMAAVCLAIYVLLGVWHRGVRSEGTIAFSERSMVEASTAARAVEDGFLRARPSLPRGAQVYLSVAATGRLGLAQTMLEGQALRVWYHDPTIQTRAPKEYVALPGQKHLFAIGSNLEVVEVDLQTLEPVGGVPPRDVQQYFAAVRSYAFGLAASGAPQEATEVLLQMPASSPTIRSYNRRLAAAVLFAAGHESDALRIVEESASIDSLTASAMTAEVLLSAVRSFRDADVLRAFQIPGEPAAVYRRYMRWFRDNGFPTEAIDFARKLQVASPGDPESAEFLRARGARPVAASGG